jgi:UvrB/UvrC motif-containing protein
MNKDLTQLLHEWPFQPGQINVRLIEGDDGLARVQVRLDLGIIQMHVNGRPDGDRPFGYPSLLDYLEARIDESETGMPPEDEPDEFQLTPEDCKALRDESLQYYHRYIALLVLEDYEGVMRDTTRNLRVLDICAQYAAEEDDRTALEQFRPYILMMRARALASHALQADEPKAALLALDAGLDTLRSCFETQGRVEAFESSSEAQLLTSMRGALTPQLPVSQKAELRHRLQEAIAQENYELAAILRDELRMLRD